MKKRIIIIISVILIAIGIFSLYQTFASSSTVISTDDSTYNITLSDDDVIEVPAKSSKIVYYKITNTNQGRVKYGVGYTSNNITVKTYFDSIDPDTGIIDYRENKFVKLKLINDSTSNDTITLSTVLGYEFGGDLIPPSGVTLVTRAVSENSNITGETTAPSSSSSTFLGGVARKNITEISFEKDNIVPAGAYNVKDISSTGDGSVMMWYTKNTDGSYELHMGSENGKVSITNGDGLFSYLENVEVLDFTNVDLSGLTSMKNMFRGCSDLTEIKFGNNKLSNITDMYHTFDGIEGLTTIDLSGFDTSKVTDMSSLFANSSVEYLDLRSFNTSSVTDMGGMFKNCTSLKLIDLRGFDTSKVTDFSEMFSGCTGLTTLDLSNFNTANATAMNSMFQNCNALTSLNLNNFNTAKVNQFGYMFSNCTKLASLNISSFNTSSAIIMHGMFYNCPKLTSLNLSHFNTAKVTSMYYMFWGCTGLTSLNVSSFNTAKVTRMDDMFTGCSNLTTLDLSSFNTAKVTNMARMFKGSTKLTTIYVSNSWTTSAVTTSTEMFNNCSALVGGSGTKYSSSYIDKTYGRIDGGTSSPGYLTSKTA